MNRVRAAAIAAAVMLSPAWAGAQVIDKRVCDSIIAAARVDTQAVTIYVTSGRVDGIPMSAAQSELLSKAVASAFIAPRPFRLTVFNGPAQMRLLRRVVNDSAAELRVPTVTGVYRFTSTTGKAVADIATVRSSMIAGFDSAAIESILHASTLKSATEIPARQVFMRVEVRFSVDSVAGSQRMTTAFFPRMRVVDAVPLRSNPPAAFPIVEKLDSTSKGEVVLRFVVGPDGDARTETVEVVRATSMQFLRSALTILPDQLFVPAKINGCPVAQVVDYPFSFVVPDTLTQRH